MSRRKKKFPHGDYVFRSEYERRQARRLELHGVVYEYEKRQLRFSEPIQGGVCPQCGSNEVRKGRLYTPDFYFPETGIFVETKGRFTSADRTKMINVIKDSLEDVRMVFMADNLVRRGGKMRYSRWAELKGIQYAVGDIPLEWCKSEV